MKKLTLLLLTPLFSFFLFSQTSEISTYTYEYNHIIYEFEYSTCLKPMLDEYFNNKEVDKLDLTELCNLKGVFHSKITGQHTGAYGINMVMYGGPERVIFINIVTPHYLPTFISATLYHEMYHQFLPTLGHCEGKCCPYILKSGDNIEIEDVIKTFNKYEKKKYFKYIRREQMRLKD
jgi:hypothetical protein